MALSAVLAACTTGPVRFLTDASATEALAPDALPSTDTGGVGDTAVVEFDRPVFDIVPIEVPPRDRGMEEPPLEVLVDIPAERPTRRVDHCYVLDPGALSSALGASSGVVAVAVFVSGVTPSPGAGEGVSVELGAGPSGTDPLAESAWRFAAARFDRDIDGEGPAGSREYDRWQGEAPAMSTAGEYAVVARARVALGPWVACDLVSSQPHAFAPAFAVPWTVAAAGAPRVAFCNLQFPRTLTAGAGTTSMPIFGRVYVPGVTDRGCMDTPSGMELTAQAGHGPAGSYPLDATWTWSDGVFNGHRDSRAALGEGDCHNVEYRAPLAAPAACAPRAYAWRVRRGAGPWTACRWAPPAEGAPTTPSWEVYRRELAGTLTVTGCP
jgi:hypothetical protein